MRDDTEVFMILASMKIQNKAVIRELPMVCDFTEDFPDDINDFLPEHELEFTINLVLRPSPVSMAPYKMSASELSEMKKQLEDFLENKFIRPSVLLWGALVLLVKNKDGSMRLCVDY